MDKDIKDILTRTKHLIVAVSSWSKLNRLAGFPSDLYDQMMELEKEIKEMEKDNG